LGMFDVCVFVFCVLVWANVVGVGGGGGGGKGRPISFISNSV